MFKTLFAATALLSTAPAIAQQAPTETRSVAYADLDLAGAAGAARLDARLRAAVKSLCPTAAGPSLRELRAVANCRDKAMLSAERQRDAAIAAAREFAAIRLASTAR